MSQLNIKYFIIFNSFLINNFKIEVIKELCKKYYDLIWKKNIDEKYLNENSYSKNLFTRTVLPS